MYREKIKYLILIIMTIILGLISRKIRIIPLYIGDFLWAVMIYFIVRFLFCKKKIKEYFILSILICYMVEISQLYQDPWINNIRNTLIGHLVLGKGFLWSDLLAYTIGVITACTFERLFFSNNNSI